MLPGDRRAVGHRIEKRLSTGGILSLLQLLREIEIVSKAKSLDGGGQMGLWALGLDQQPCIRAEPKDAREGLEGRKHTRIVWRWPGVGGSVLWNFTYLCANLTCLIRTFSNDE